MGLGSTGRQSRAAAAGPPPSLTHDPLRRLWAGRRNVFRQRTQGDLFVITTVQHISPPLDNKHVCRSVDALNRFDMADPGVTRPRHLRPLCAFATETHKHDLLKTAGRTDAAICYISLVGLMMDNHVAIMVTGRPRWVARVGGIRYDMIAIGLHVQYNRCNSI